MLLIGAILSTSIHASPSALCPETGISIGFFNGVGNDIDQATSNLENLATIQGNKYAATGEPIHYQLYYNHTKGLGADLIEVFDQRLGEQGESLQGYFELYWDILAGRRNVDHLAALLSQIDEPSAKFIEELHEITKAAAVSEFTWITHNSPTFADYAEHRATIESMLAARQKLVFIGHSQGNLFMNYAYNYAMPKAGAQAVKVIHVAPASQKLYGKYTLSDHDLIIALLRATPGVVPESNASAPFNLSDISGHGFIETYLKEGTETRKMVIAQLDEALSTVQRPPAAASTGAFTVTLTWDGFGDVDLHVREPNGTNVYSNMRDGSAGQLVTAASMANGPEQYVTSCDASKIVMGNYELGINNVSGAENRKAIIQVSSGTGDVLLKHMIDVGPVRGRAGANEPVHVMSMRPGFDANGELTMAEL